MPQLQRSHASAGVSQIHSATARRVALSLTVKATDILCVRHALVVDNDIEILGCARIPGDSHVRMQVVMPSDCIHTAMCNIMNCIEEGEFGRVAPL